MHKYRESVCVQVQDTRKLLANDAIQHPTVLFADTMPIPPDIDFSAGHTKYHLPLFLVFDDRERGQVDDRAGSGSGQRLEFPSNIDAQLTRSEAQQDNNHSNCDVDPLVGLLDRGQRFLGVVHSQLPRILLRPLVHRQRCPALSLFICITSVASLVMPPEMASTALGDSELLVPGTTGASLWLSGAKEQFPPPKITTRT